MRYKDNDTTRIAQLTQIQHLLHKNQIGLTAKELAISIFPTCVGVNHNNRLLCLFYRMSSRYNQIYYFRLSEYCGGNLPCFLTTLE